MAVNTVIATNVLALNTNRTLGCVSKNKQKNMNRLSSGKRVNTASDDAASLTISEKMKSQIRGLNMASRNTNDTINMLQVAEGAMNEMGSIFQRVRELTINISSDTNAKEDKEKMAKEMVEIIYEVENIIETTQFNGIEILNSGNVSKKFQVGSNSFEFLDLNLNFKSFKGLFDAFDENLFGEINRFFNGTVKTSIENVLAQDPFEIGNTCTVYNIKTALCDYKTFLEDVIEAISSMEVLGFKEIEELKEEMERDINRVIQETRIKAEQTFLERMKNPNGNSGMWVTGEGQIGSLFDKEQEIPFPPNNIRPTPDSIRVDVDMVLAAIRDPDKIVAIDSDLDREDPESFPNRLERVLKEYSEKFNDEQMYTYDLLSELEDYAMGNIDISNERFSTTYLSHFDSLITYVSERRGQIGAIINRLEYSNESLKVYGENLEAANSRIEDADMAREMMSLTSNEILINSALGLLSQANQSKEKVLQLLQ